MKKLISFLLIFSICLSLSFFVVNAEPVSISVDAKSALLMDFSSGRVLYAANEQEKLYPASVTKIMSLLLFMRALDTGRITLGQTVTASSSAAAKGGSQIWLEQGETMTVDELLKAVAIASANDACTALAEHIAGSEQSFVRLMNECACELGMVNTHFDNCTGLDDDTDTHKTTAYDIALMARELLKYEKIKDYTTTWMDTLRNGETQLVNTNRLVRFYEGTTGLKTGTTTKAGHCLCAAAERDGLQLIAVVMGAQSSEARFEGAKELLNWGFANYERATPEIDTSLIPQVRVLRGITDYITPVLYGLGELTLEVGKKQQLVTELELCQSIEAPVKENQVLGVLRLKIGEEIIEEYPLINQSELRRIGFLDVLQRFFKSLVKNDKY